MVTLKDICRKITDGSHNPPAGIESSHYVMLSSKNIENDDITFDNPRFISKDDFFLENKRTNIEEDDLLLTIVGAIGRVAIVQKEHLPFCVQRSVAVLKLNRSKVLPRYAMYYLQSKKNLLEQESHGVAQKGVYLKQVEHIPFPLISLEKQEKIVQRLDSLQSIIKLKNFQLLKFDQLVKSRFVEMFGESLSNSRNWKLLELTQVCHKIYGGGTPSKKHPEYFTGTIPWVSPKDMKSSVICDTIDHITKDAITNSTTKIIPAKSLLMVIRSGILKHTLPIAINNIEVTINQDMKAFVTKDIIKTEFLMHYFKSIEYDILSKIRGVTADNIDFKAFKKRKIIVPPIALQEKFCTFVQQVDKSKLAVKQSLKKLETLKNSLMQEYFG